MLRNTFIFLHILFLISCSSGAGTESPSMRTSEISGSDKKVCILLADLEEGILFKAGSNFCRETSPVMYAFQPVLALAALETGTWKDPQGSYPWDKTKYPYIRWQKDQNLRSSLDHSVVWYFQKIWNDTGALKLKTWLSKVGLPTDLPSDSNRVFWMDGGYVWTPEEFFSFLWKFFSKDLEIRPKNRSAVLEGLSRNPGEIRNPSGIHFIRGPWGNAKEFYSDSGTGYGAGRSVSWYWFLWKKERKTFLFLSKVESASETLPPLEAAEFGTNYLRENGLWENYFSD